MNVLGLVLGMAAATGDARVIVTAGLAATMAESIAMAGVAFTATGAEGAWARQRGAHLLERMRRALDDARAAAARCPRVATAGPRTGSPASSGCSTTSAQPGAATSPRCSPSWRRCARRAPRPRRSPWASRRSRDRPSRWCRSWSCPSRRRCRSPSSLPRIVAGGRRPPAGAGRRVERSACRAGDGRDRARVRPRGYLIGLALRVPLDGLMPRPPRPSGRAGGLAADVVSATPAAMSRHAAGPRGRAPAAVR